MRKKYLGILLLGILVPALAFPTALYAALSDSTTVRGTVPESLSVSAPDYVDLPSLVPGTTVSNATAASVTVQTNLTGWHLRVAEDGASPDGKMLKSGADPLTYPIKVKGGDTTSFTSLTSAVDIRDGSGEIPGTDNINNIYFEQQVHFDDDPGLYEIIVVFTASPI